MADYRSSRKSQKESKDRSFIRWRSTGNSFELTPEVSWGFPSIGKLNAHQSISWRWNLKYAWKKENKNKICCIYIYCCITILRSRENFLLEVKREMEGIEAGLVGLRRAFRSGKTRGIEWRTGQLRALLKLLAENEARIFEALKQDLGKHPVEAYRDEVLSPLSPSLFWFYGNLIAFSIFFIYLFFFFI